LSSRRGYAEEKEDATVSTELTTEVTTGRRQNNGVSCE